MALQTFTAGQVLTAAQVNSLQTNDFNQTVSTKTGDYVLVAADKGTRVVMNSASAQTITVNTDLFNAGDTLFIQNIGAGVCTITAGTATVSTAGSLALAQNAGGTLYFTSAGVSIFFPSAVATTAGKILQVVSTAKTDTFTSTNTSYADITGLSVAITPTLATSKILVFVNVTGLINFSSQANFLQIVRSSTAIGIGDAGNNRTRATFMLGLYGGSDHLTNGSMTFLDAPATTSATTYKMQMRVTSGTGCINRGVTDTDTSNFGRTISTITVMEVAA